MVRFNLKNIFKANEDYILDLARGQMRKGMVDLDSEKKRFRYAASTVRQKRKKARFKDLKHITLRWDGDFHESLKLLLFKDKMVISSPDPKHLYLEAGFENALGLSEKSKSDLRDKLRDELIRAMR